MNDERLLVAIGQLPSLLLLGLEAALLQETIELAGSNLATQDLVAAVRERSVQVVILDEQADVVGIGRQLRAVRPELGILILLHRPNHRAPDRLFAQGATTCVSTDADRSGLAAAVRFAHEGVRLFVPGASADRSPPISSLTAREAEIAALIVAERSTEEIADTLGIGKQTVYRHVTAILRKMHVSSRRDLRHALAATVTPK